MTIRVALVGAVIATVAALAAPAAADRGKVGYPNSIASTGDSITRAFDTCAFPYVDCPANSWSTGTNAAVKSVYRRILAVNPAIDGRNFNDAKTGGEMVDLPAQAAAAASEGVDLVTILMGANDVCASSESTMTPVRTLRAELQAALGTVSARLPDARIQVGSIPNIRRLWQVLHMNVAAVTVWWFADICQSMLKNPLSTAPADVDRRARVAQRNRDDNDAIRDVCAQFVHCRFDGYAAYRVRFDASDVTTRDFFHPNVAGQAKAAAAQWASGFDYGDRTAPTTTASIDAAGAVTLAATDDAGLLGIEYRLSSDVFGYRRYVAPVALVPGATITFRAVDANGNVEASKSLTL